MSSSEELARSLIPVRDVMRAPPVVARPTSVTSDVIKKMVEENIGSVIVVSNDDKPIGIVTERDVLKRVVGVGRDSKETSVKDIMSTPVITIESHKTLREALKLMRDNRVRRLAVKKDDRLEGQVTERRILDALIFISKLD